MLLTWASDVGAYVAGRLIGGRKLIPSVKNGAPPDVLQLTSTVLQNVVVREVHKGPATLRFGMSPADPFHRIPVEEIVGGYYYHTDFTLEDGVVVHDYLA